MTGQETRVRFVDQAKSLFKMRYELFGQRLSPRAVVDRICELVMAGREGPIQINVNHLGALPIAHLFDELSSLPPRACMVSAETVNVIDACVSLLRVFAITWRQSDSGAHHDISPPEFAEHRTLNFDQLDVLCIGWFEARRSRASERQFNRLRFHRVQIFDLDDRAGQIAFILTVISVSMIPVEQ